MGNDTVQINPREISQADIQTGCQVLASSIRLALQDPERRAEYEEWKKERRNQDER